MPLASYTRILLAMLIKDQKRDGTNKVQAVRQAAERHPTCNTCGRPILPVQARSELNGVTTHVHRGDCAAA